MKATIKNICDILGYHNRHLKMKSTTNKNGFIIQGFLPRIALHDLMNNFHCYQNNVGLCVITPGRLSNLKQY